MLLIMHPRNRRLLTATTMKLFKLCTDQEERFADPHFGHVLPPMWQARSFLCTQSIQSTCTYRQSCKAIRQLFLPVPSRSRLLLFRPRPATLAHNYSPPPIPIWMLYLIFHWRFGPAWQCKACSIRNSPCISFFYVQ